MFTETEKPDTLSKIIFLKNLIFNKNLSLLDMPYPIEFIKNYDALKNFKLSRTLVKLIKSTKFLVSICQLSLISFTDLKLLFHSKISQSQLVDAKSLKRLRHKSKKIKRCCILANPF